MRTKTVIPLVVGLAIGFLAIKMAFDMVQNARAEQGGTKGVVVAAAAIESTFPLQEKMLKIKPVPAALVPAGAFTEIKQVLNRVAATTIPRGVMIDPAMLAPPGAEPGLRSRIPDGYRAVACKVDEASSVAGFLVPGSRVDVSAIETLRNGGRTRVISRIILRNIEVGAVGQSLNTVGPDGKSGKLSRSVTLLLRPEDVPKFQLASDKGRISLALRNGSDGGLEGTEVAVKKAKDAFANLFKPRARPKPVVIEKPKAMPEPPRIHIVEVVRGTQSEKLQFTLGGAAVGLLTGGQAPSVPQALFKDEPADKPDDNKPSPQEDDTEVGE